MISVCIFVCTEGSRHQLNRYGSPLPCSFSQFLGRFITILEEGTSTKLTPLTKHFTCHQRLLGGVAASMIKTHGRFTLVSVYPILLFFFYQNPAQANLIIHLDLMVIKFTWNNEIFRGNKIFCWKLNILYIKHIQPS